jgi:hypothetical protein
MTKKMVINRNQIENLYRANGISNYRLKTLNDLLKAHGIDAEAVPGYQHLSDEQRALYRNFIINFFNAFGLESRATIIPTGIYYVQENKYLVKEDPSDEYCTVAGSLVYAIACDGSKSILHKWIHKDYKSLSPTLSDKSLFYLRIEYYHQGHKEWLHVMSEASWY